MPENLALLLTAIPLMGSPGPATLSIAATSSEFGAFRSVRYMAGVTCGTTTVMVMIATGITGILFALPGVLPVLTAAALVYILYLAYRIATAPVLSQDAGSRPPPSMAGGYLLAIGNPKAFAAIGVIFASVVIVPGNPFWDATAKVVSLFLLVVIINSSWLMIGASLARFLRNPRTGRAINVFFAALLVLSVVLAALL